MLNQVVLIFEYRNDIYTRTSWLHTPTFADSLPATPLKITAVPSSHEPQGTTHEILEVRVYARDVVAIVLKTSFAYCTVLAGYP